MFSRINQLYTFLQVLTRINEIIYVQMSMYYCEKKLINFYHIL